MTVENLSESELQEAQRGYQEAARSFSARTYEFDSHWEEEQYMLENFPDDFENSGWDREHLEATTKWKWAGLWANYASSSENTDEKVDRLIKEAVSEDDHTESVEVLKELDGVSDATATVLLTFAKPEQHTVMDVNAIAALRELDMWDGGDEANAEEYPEYLSTAKEISDKFGLTLREVDRALWKLGEGD